MGVSTSSYESRLIDVINYNLFVKFSFQNVHHREAAASGDEDQHEVHRHRPPPGENYLKIELITETFSCHRRTLNSLENRAS